MHIKNIVAIGGGGFGRSLGSLEIEKYIVSLINKKRPKICFIPTASGDSSLYKLNFYRAFSKLDLTRPFFVLDYKFFHLRFELNQNKPSLIPVDL